MAKEKAEKVHEFTTHKHDCKQCISVDISKPATMANCCLKGAPLLRDYLNSLAAPIARKRQATLRDEFNREADGKSYRTTKAKLNEVMRFK
jgi:hypothetical protein